MTPKERAKQAAEYLFTNSAGEKAVRLALIGPDGRDLGGWDFDSVASAIERRIDEAIVQTFTITDARRLGGLLATPLLNTPQVAILGVHRVAELPVVRYGEIVARPIGMLSVGVDHRALDGATAASFLLDVIERIERGDSPTS